MPQHTPGSAVLNIVRETVSPVESVARGPVVTTVTSGVARSTRPTVPIDVVPSRAHPDAVLAAIVVGGAGAIALWWAGTPNVHGLGDWVTNAGRITGLLAGYGVVVLVALMARIPPLERGVGADTLARWHSHGGRYVVSLITAHALLIIWGYSITAHTDVVHQTGTLITSYPDVLMATVGGLLFLATGVISARAARRRLQYETWFYLHLYTYLAIALAFSHQFSTGAQFVDNRPARVAWSTLYLVVGAAIVWYRFVVPVRQAARHGLRVAAVHPEGPGVVSVILTGRHLEQLRARSGQFFRWRFLTRDLWWVSGPYSLSAAPRPDSLRITVKDLGEHSGALARLRPGVRVLAEGPYGAMTAERRRQDKVLLIAGGIGITPVRALFESVPARPGDLTLIYRARTPAEVVFGDELRAIAAARGARLHVITGRRDQLGWDPLSATALVRNVPALPQHDVYVCGPDAMTRSVVAQLRRAKVPRSRIHSESFEF